LEHDFKIRRGSLKRETIPFHAVNFKQPIEMNLSCRRAFMDESQLPRDQL